MYRTLGYKELSERIDLLENRVNLLGGGGRIVACPELCRNGMPGYACHTQMVSGLGAYP